MMTPRSGPPSSVTAGSVATIAAAARRMTLKVPTRLIWMTRLKFSSGSTPSRPSTLPGVAIPAQLTTIRSGPRATAASTAACTSSSLVTSAGTKTARLAGCVVLPAGGPDVAPGVQLRGERRAGGAWQVHQDHRGAGVEQAPRRCGPQAGGSARNQRNSTFDVHASSLMWNPSPPRHCGQRHELTANIS